MHERSEVKGAWFVTARTYVLEVHGMDTLQAIATRVGGAERAAIEDPIASAWYPEEALQSMTAAAHEVVAQGDERRFVQFIEGCTEQGVTRFFSVLIQLSSPGFIVSKVPFMWERTRRGPGQVEVSRTETGSRIEYSRFPYFADPLYRLLTLGSLRAVVRRCTGAEPMVEIAGFGDDHCTADVWHE